jgi:hypothetical protein
VQDIILCLPQRIISAYLDTKKIKIVGPGDSHACVRGVIPITERGSVAPNIQNIRVSIIQGLFLEKSNYSLKKSNRPNRFV